jgi:hypothetical protein
MPIAVSGDGVRCCRVVVTRALCVYRVHAAERLPFQLSSG